MIYYDHLASIIKREINCIWFRSIVIGNTFLYVLADERDVKNNKARNVGKIFFIIELVIIIIIAISILCQRFGMAI